MRIFGVAICLSLCAFPLEADAQCHQAYTNDFGIGSVSDLSPYVGLSTTYTYESGAKPCQGENCLINIGEYSILAADHISTDPTSFPGQDFWGITGDADGSPKGRFMLVNVGGPGTEILRLSVSNLHLGKQYKFKVSLINANKTADSRMVLYPNIDIGIIDKDGSLLTDLTTEDIPKDVVWHTYTLTFHASSDEVQVIFRNKYAGGNGNDIGIDNIKVQGMTCMDADLDGVPNVNDSDSDNDGIADAVEQFGENTCEYASLPYLFGFQDGNIYRWKSDGIYDGFETTLEDPGLGDLDAYDHFSSDGEYFYLIESDNGEIHAWNKDGSYSRPMGHLAVAGGVSPSSFDFFATDGSYFYGIRKALPNTVQRWEMNGAYCCWLGGLDPGAGVTPSDLQFMGFDGYHFMGISGPQGGSMQMWNASTGYCCEEPGLVFPDGLSLSDFKDFAVARAAFYPDSDCDGTPDYLDLDSDNDNIPDIVEAGGIDADKDCRVDYPQSKNPASMTDIDGDGYSEDPVIDTDQDGVADIAPDGDTSNPLILDSNMPNEDTDQDGIPNFKDIDSDGDGIVDVIESQLTETFRGPEGIDADQNGLDDGYGDHLLSVPTDTDKDLIPDYLDLDSDQDGTPDYVEGTDLDADGQPDIRPSGIDSDQDGLDNAFDWDAVGMINRGGPANNSQSPGQLPNHNNPNTREKDWRENKDGNQNPGGLIFFEVSKSGNDALVGWGITPNPQHDYFIVERSIDKQNFQYVDMLARDESKTESDKYEYLDRGVTNLKLPILYYRIKTVFRDGSFTFSDHLELSLKDDGATLKLSAYPNPVNDILTMVVAGPVDMAFSIIVLNSVGQTMTRKDVEKIEENHIEKLNVSSWAPGHYYVKLNGDNLSDVYKVVVE